MTISRNDALALDAADPLAPVRAEFETDDTTIYLDANSLGPMPKAVRASAAVFFDEWSKARSKAWGERPWLSLPERLGDAIAPHIGAHPGEVIFCDSTTVNQFKAVAHALAINAGRQVIVTQDSNFPTDVHVLQALVERSAGQLSLQFVDSEDDAIAALGPQTAVAALTHTDYRSGERWNMARVNAAARAAGVLTVWDLSHSAGAVPVDLNGSGTDFAIGCGYKYLCSGPGGPAYIYARAGLADAAPPALAGWIGHADVFAFARDYQPHPGIKRFLTGTPMIGANAMAEPMIALWPAIDPRMVWAKHAALSAVLISLLDEVQGVDLISPRDPARRGGNVSFRCPGNAAVVAALIARGIICSFRAPDAIRFGISPLTTRFADIYDAVAALRAVLRAL